MKTLRMFGMALVAMMLSFSVSSCSDDDDNFIPVDYSQDLVGTWTLLEPGLAVGMEIEADGSVIATTLVNDEYSEDVPGKIEVENNKVSLTLEDGTIFKGLLEIIPGEAFVIVDEESGLRLTHRLCKQDLSKEILGMWVNTNIDPTSDSTDDISIQTFREDGTMIWTCMIFGSDDYILNEEIPYKVIGDLLIHKSQTNDSYIAIRLSYAPDATAYGDIMTFNMYISNDTTATINTNLRIKQHLELPGQKYDYIKTYLTNATGLDKDFNAGGFIINFSKLNGNLLDKMLKTLLFNVEFPDANTIKYSYTYNGETVSASAPIEVEGNKMTVKMDKTRGYFRDMDLYAFQDKDNTQMHFYMSKYAFINYFGNIAISLLAETGQLDPHDQAAVDAVFNELTQIVKTINVSFIMSKSK